MREIKFRAFLKNWGQIVEVRAINFEQGIVRHEDVDWDMVRNKEMPVKKETLLSNCKLMQYTGLKDKNGLEIYEGDICKFKDVWPVIVSFKTGNFVIGKYEDLLLSQCHKDITVIGNIYQNPELLEEL